MIGRSGCAGAVPGCRGACLVRGRMPRNRGERLIRLALTVVVALMLAACASLPGPRSVTLTAPEVEKLVEAQLGSVFELFKGLDVRRPEVALMPMSDRLLLTWAVRVPDGPTSAALGVTVAIAGKPVLDASRTAVLLTEVKLDDVRITGVPVLFGFGLAQLGERKGATLSDLPLLALPPSLQTRHQVAYVATGVAVTFTGLRVDLEPR
jgi:hypothetical protein